MSRLHNLILCLMLPALAFSQSAAYSSPDSTVRIGTQSDLLLLPLWSPPSSTIVASKSDSLTQLSLPELRKPKPLTRFQRWLGIGLIAAGSSLSYYYHQLAEDTYQEYLRSGNPAELDRLFNRAERFDRLSGWYFVSAETGLVLLTLSFVFGP